MSQILSLSKVGRAAKLMSPKVNLHGHSQERMLWYTSFSPLLLSTGQGRNQLSTRPCSDTGNQDSARPFSRPCSSFPGEPNIPTGEPNIPTPKDEFYFQEVPVKAIKETTKRPNSSTFLKYKRF